MNSDHFIKELEAMPDYNFMEMYRYKLKDYVPEAVELINLEYEKRKTKNPNLELYYPVQFEEQQMPPLSGDINFPEYIKINGYILADPGKRLGAYIIDIFLFYIFFMLIMFFIDESNYIFWENTAAVVFLGLTASFLAVQTWMLSQRGQTLGKIIMKLKIVKLSTGENGGFVTNVLLRFVVNALLTLVPLYGLIDNLSIFREGSRCIHDQIAGTVVVDLKRQAEYGFTAGRSEPKGYSGGKKGIAALSAAVGAVAVIAIICVIWAFTETDYIKEAKTNYENANYEKAIEYCEKALQEDYKAADAFLYKARSLNGMEQYAEAIETLQEAERLKIADFQIFIELGCSNYNLGRYNEALRCFTEAVNGSRDSEDAYLWKAYTHLELGEYDAATGTIEDLLGVDPQNALAYNAKGNAYVYKEEFSQAVKAFDEAIRVNPDYVEAYINKIRVLYYQKKYTECISSCESTLKIYPDKLEAIWYLGDCYSAKGQHDTAISCYEKALNLEAHNDEIIISIGWEYYHKQDYEKANEYVEKALELNTENYFAIELKRQLEEALKPEGERIANFIRSGYLYYDKVNNINDILNEFTLKEQVEINDIAKLIASVRYREDIFTFLLHGEHYDEFINEDMSNHIDYRDIDPGTVYVRINSFTSGTANEFRDIAEGIEAAESKKLIIDLRDNPGGLSDPTNNILDILLPRCTASYMIYRDGRIYTYESSGEQISFKHIYLFVNQNSASSSELLSLGLKKHLNNVTIIGSPTVGKGVGQIMFENKQKKYVLFLVNHYWNVIEKNIMGESISPDIPVNSGDINDYLKAVEESL